VRKRACLAAGLLLTAACRPEDVIHRVGWFSAMVTQRSVKPYARPPRDPVEGTVPVTGPAPAPAPETVDRLANPRTRTSQSINRGKFVYETYCLVCHGAGGHGDGPISSDAGGPFPGVRSLVTDEANKRTDGYLYGVIVNAQAMGRALMPRYGDKIRGTDAWDLVNYVRTLQGLARSGGRP
jgi:mono/diheme cytochrome c family protein